MTLRVWPRNIFAAFDHVIVWATGFAVILLMASMVTSIVLGVFFRYVLASALPWPEEFARFAMIWVTMLGAGLVLRYNGHIAVTFLIEWLPARARTIVNWAGLLLVTMFLVLLIVYGAEMTGRVVRQTAPAMQISMSIPNIALPVGALLMLYHLIVISVAPRYRSPRLPGTQEKPQS
jgi:TRAP-type C4-dicarboxylate transport system permease small subunit|tara:strand:- start:273 stop:803 length:531 start_codon:yes stop_codon:yes gene_type:complete